MGCTHRDMTIGCRKANYLKCFKMLTYKRMQNIGWTDMVRNETIDGNEKITEKY